MPRKQHQYHYIYKVTCNVTGKYYIGMHSTSNLEDGYFGSGKVLKRSLNKYGKENHSIEILEWLTDRSSLKSKERELVNESLLNDSLCMNLALGGGGGFVNENHKQKWILAGSAAGKAKLAELWKDPDYAKTRSLKIKDVMSRPEVKDKALAGFNKYRGTPHTAETKERLSEIMKLKQNGISNSQFGTMWITNGILSKKIRKTDIVPEGWRLGRKIVGSEDPN